MTNNQGEPEHRLRHVNKGSGDHRWIIGQVGARIEPKLEAGDVSVWRFSEGQRYSLFLSWEDAEDLADALDAMLEYRENQ